MRRQYAYLLLVLLLSSAGATRVCAAKRSSLNVLEFTLNELLVANSSDDDSDDYYQSTWDLIQSQFNEISDGISPEDWNTYKVAEGEQYVYDQAVGEIVPINKKYSADFPYFHFSKLEVDDGHPSSGNFINNLKWSFSTDDYKHLFYDLTTRLNGIDNATGATKVEVRRYFRLYGEKSDYRDIYVGFTIPAGKILFPTECINQPNYGIDPSEMAVAELGTKMKLLEELNNIYKKLQKKSSDIYSFYGWAGSETDDLQASTIKEFVNPMIHIIEHHELSYYKVQAAVESLYDNDDYDCEFYYKWFKAEVEQTFANIDNAITKAHESIVSCNVSCNAGGNINWYGEGEEREVTNNSEELSWFPENALTFNDNDFNYSNPEPRSEVGISPEAGYYIKKALLNGAETSKTSFSLIELRNSTLEVEFERIDPNNELALSDITSAKGSRVQLPIVLKNDKAIAGFQFDLKLPKGVSVVTNGDGDLMCSLTNRAGSHVVSASNPSNQLYRFVVVALDNRNEFSGADGAVLNVTLELAENISEGDYEILMQNVELTAKVNGELTRIISVEDVSTLTVDDVLIGDANGDGDISVIDALSIISYILQEPPARFIKSAADVNGDGDISVIDAISVIDMILKK